MKNILVVGGAGYVGGAVTDLLLASQYNFRVYDALLFESEYRKPVDFVFGDIRNHEKLQKHLDWADVVIWLAALVADGSCNLNPELAVELNQLSVQWLADDFDGRIIFPSSCLVYKIQDVILDENSALAPKTIYIKTKCEAEKILNSSNSLIFRLSTLFGLGDDFSRPRFDLVTNLLTARAVIEKKMTVFGGQQYRPFLHVRDAAKIMVENIDADHTGIFNISFDNMKIIDLAKKIQSAVPDSEIEIKKSSVQETGDYRVSSSKAKEILEFNPIFTVEDGIQEIKELVESGRLKDIYNSRYSNEAHLRINPPL